MLDYLLLCIEWIQNFTTKFSVSTKFLPCLWRSGCYSGVELVKTNYMDPLPMNSSSMSNLVGKSKIQNESTGVMLLMVSPN